MGNEIDGGGVDLIKDSTYIEFEILMKIVNILLKWVGKYGIILLENWLFISLNHLQILGTSCHPHKLVLVLQFQWLIPLLMV